MALYAVLGYRPPLVADMVNDAFYSATARSTFDDLFTHSRLGNATMVDSDGLLKWGPHNLLTYSEDFSNAAWTDGSISGGTRVDGSLSVSSSEGYVYAQQLISVTTGVSHTIEVDVTCDTAVANVPLRAGLGTSSDTNLVNFSTGETKRVSFSVTPTSGTLTIGLDARNAVVPGGSDETGYTVTLDLASAYRSDLGGMAPVPADARVAGSDTYVPTTSTAKYLPRRHNHVYNGSAWVDAGTLIETEARTNLVTHSEDFTDASWTKAGASITANAETAPDGNATADKLVENSSTSEHLVSRVNIGSGQKTASVFFKSSERTQAAIYFFNATDGVSVSYFDLAAGTVISGDGEIEAFGGGWYRCGLSRTATVNDNVYFCAAVSGSTSYTGNGTSGIYIWGAQLE